MDEMQVKQEILLEIKRAGFAASASDISMLAKKIGELNKSDDELQKTTKEVTSAHIKLSKEIDKNNKKVAEAAKKVGLLDEAHQGLKKAITEVRSGMKSLVFPASLGAAVKITDEYNKRLLLMSSRVNRVGMGVTKLEKHLSGLSKTLSLTKQETHGLFTAFERQVKFVSLSLFNSLLEKARKSVGANSEAIGELMASVTSLSHSFPALVEQINKLNDSSSKGYKEALESKVKALYITKQISDVEYRNIMQVVGSNRIISAQDSKREANAQAQVKAMQELKRQAERVALVWGNTLLPILEKIAKMLGIWGDASDRMGDKVSGMLGGGTGAKQVGGVVNAASSALPYVGMYAAGKGIAYGGKTALKYGGKAAISGASKLIGRGAVTAATTAGGSTLLGVGTTGAGVVGAAGTTGAGVVGAGSAGAGSAFGLPTALATQVATTGATGTAATATSVTIVGIAAAAAAVIATAAVGFVAGLAIDKYLIAPNLSEKEDSMGKKAAHWEVWLAKKYAGMIGGSNFDENIEDVLGSNRAHFKEEQERLAKEKKDNPYGRHFKYYQDQNDPDSKMNKKKNNEMERYKNKNSNLSGKELEIEAISLRKTIDSAGKRTGRDELEKLKKQKDQYASFLETDAGKETEDGKKILDNMKEELKIQEDKVIKAEDEDILTKDAIKKHEIIRGLKQDEVTKQNVLLTKVEKLNELYEAQSALLKSNISKMQYTGKGSMEEEASGIDEAVNKLYAKNDAARDYIKILDKYKKSGFLNTEEALSAGGITKAEYDEIKKWGDIDLTHTQIDIKRKSMQSDINMEAQKESEIRAQAGSYLNKQLELTKAETGVMKQLVSLADNYAIGVGASVDQRLRSFQSSGKIIGVLKEQLTAVQYQIDIGQNVIENKIKEKNIEQEILSVQQERAQSVKALRDGWVSAIGAMNTGAGAFSKIMMDQTKNTGAMLSLLGDDAILNKYTGSNKAGAGYGSSEQLTVSGGIRGKKKNLAYRSYGDELMGYRGGMRDLEMNERDNLMRQMEERTDKAMSKGGATLTLGANKNIKSAAVGAGGIGRTRYNYQSNVKRRNTGSGAAQSDVNLNLGRAEVNIEIKDMNYLSNQISKKLYPVLDQLAQEIVQKIAR